MEKILTVESNWCVGSFDSYFFFDWDRSNKSEGKLKTNIL